MWGRFENDQRVNNYQNPMICNCNLIWLSSLPRSSQCSLSFKFPHQNRVCISFLYIYATFSVHLIQITFGEEHKSWSSSLCSFLQSPVSSTLVGPKYLLQYSTLKRLQLIFFPPCEKPSYKLIQIICKITVLCSLFKLIDSEWEDKRLWAKWQQVFPMFTVSSQAIQVPVEIAFWWSPVSPEYQQWCTQYILHADKCWWLPGQHHHCQSGSALTHLSSCAQSSPVHSKPVHDKMK